MQLATHEPVREPKHGPMQLFDAVDQRANLQRMPPGFDWKRESLPCLKKRLWKKSVDGAARLFFVRAFFCCRGNDWERRPKCFIL